MTDRPAEPTTEKLIKGAIYVAEACEKGYNPPGTPSIIRELCQHIATLTAAKEAAEKRAEALEDELGGYRIQCSDLKDLLQTAEKQCEERERGTEHSPSRAGDACRRSRTMSGAANMTAPDKITLSRSVVEILLEKTREYAAELEAALSSPAPTDRTQAIEECIAIAKHYAERFDHEVGPSAYKDAYSDGADDVLVEIRALLTTQGSRQTVDGE